MRKISSILLGAVLATTGVGTTYAQSAKTVPYSSPITLSSSAFDDGWTAIDLDGDGYTWEPYSTSATSIGGTSSSAATKGNTGKTKDDWLISPPIHLENGKEYRLFYGMRAESTTHPQNLDVYFTTSNDPATLKTKTPLDRYENYTNTTFEKIDKTINCTETGDYYLVFNCKSISDNWYMMVAVAQVFENAFTPASVTNFKAERNNSKPRTVEVTLSWVLPTQSVLGDAFTEDQTVDHIYIYRDGAETPTFTLNNGEKTLTDNEESGLTSGIHTYEIEVEVAGKKSGRVSATTKYVGPVSPATLPHTWTPTTQDDFDDWIVLKGENATTTETWTWYSYYGVARFYQYANKVEEDYIVAPPFNVEEAGYYKITVDAALLNVNYNATNIFKVLYGTAPTEEGLNNVACEKIDFTSSSRTPYSYVVKIDEPGTYYVAVEAASTNAQATNTYVYAISMEETEKTPAAVSNLKATPDPEFGLSVTLTWDCPEVSAAGDPLEAEEYTIKVYKGDTLLTTLDGGVNTYTDTVDATGVYTYSVETVAPQGASMGKQTVTTRWVGPHQVPLPYSTTFSTSDNTATIWDIIDHNNDGKTWHYYSNSYRCTQSDNEGETSGTRLYDDYFLSPWFEMTPGYYEVKFRAIGGTTSLPMTHHVGLVEAGTFVADRSELEQEKVITSTSTNSTSDSYNPLQSYIIKIDEEGTYQIVFAAIGEQPVVTGSDLDYSGYGISNFSIAYYPVLPGVATDLTAVAAENEVLQATVTWTNPSDTNVEDLELEAITKAVVLRDGAVATTITEGLTPGEEATFVDTKETGLTGGPHTYSVEIYNAEGKSTTAAPTFKLSWVGGGLDIVGSGHTHTYAEFDELWSFVDADNNQSTYGDNGWSVPGTTALKLDETNNDETYDDWAVSPRFNIESEGMYELRFKTFIGASYKNYAPYSFDVYIGEGETPTVESYQKIGTVTSTNGNSTASSGQEYISLYIKGSDLAAALEGEEEEEEEEGGIVEVPTGTLRFALHATMKGGVNIQTLTIKPYILIVPPYSNNFATSSDLDGFSSTPNSTTTNADKIWQKGEGDYLVLDASGNASGASMSNLVTPAVAMEEGKPYKVSFKVWHSLASASSNFTFSYANNPEMTGATTEALKSLTADNMSYEDALTYTTLITPTVDGNMYLKIYCISQNGDIVYLTDLDIEEFIPEFPISLNTPYLNEFSSPFDTYGYVIDPTGRWALNSGGFLLAGTDGDATITSPAFAMKDGRNYRVSFDMWSGNVNNVITLKYGSDLEGELSEALKVFINSAANAEGEPAEGEIRGSYTTQQTAYRAETIITGNSDGIMYLVFDTHFIGRSNFGIDNLMVEDISPIELPYENALNTAESLEGFTMDPETGGWQFTVNNTLVINGPGSGTTEGTLITPAFEVENGKEYMVKIDLSGNPNSTMTFLTGSDMEDMTEVMTTNLTNNTQTYKIKVIGNEEGVLYVGLKGNCFARSSIQASNLYVGDYVVEPDITGNMVSQLDMNAGMGEEPELEEPETWNVGAYYDEATHELTIFNMFNEDEYLPAVFVVTPAEGSAVAACQVAKTYPMGEDEEDEEVMESFYRGIDSTDGTITANIYNTEEGTCVLELEPWGEAFDYNEYDMGWLFVFGYYNTVITLDTTIEGVPTVTKSLSMGNVQVNLSLEELGSVTAEFIFEVETEGLGNDPEVEITYAVEGDPDNDYGIVSRNENGEYVLTIGGFMLDTQYSIEITATCGTLSDSQTVEFDTTNTGIEGIGADGDARYFDINGFEVKNPEAGQMLIRVKNGQATKVVVK